MKHMYTLLGGGKKFKENQVLKKEFADSVRIIDDKHLRWNDFVAE